MRRAALLAAALALAAVAPAQARGHRFLGGRPHAPKAFGEGHRRSGMAQIPSLGPSEFHPVKRYKGFSYLQHEKHPEKD